jgi:hypothetical protein
MLRRQPLRGTVRIDTLIAETRAAATKPRPRSHRGSTPLTLDDRALRAVLDNLARTGRVVIRARQIGLAETPPAVDPQIAERVARLLSGLTEAGTAPPRVEPIAARLGIPPHVVDQLRANGELVSLAPGIDYPREMWEGLRARLARLRGPWSVGRVRDELRTSRRHAEAILQRERGGVRPRRRGG